MATWLFAAAAAGMLLTPPAHAAPTATRSADDSSLTAIDEDGSVVFAASLDGVEGFYRSAGGAPGPPLVEERDGIVRFRSPAITDAGLAMLAEYDALASYDLQLLLIGEDDALFGSTVETLALIGANDAACRLRMRERTR